MLKESLRIDLDQEYKKIIVHSVQQGLKKYAVQYRNEYNTKTNNGQHSIIWDFINTEIINGMPPDMFEVIVARRGIWELILIFDKKTKCLYSLMKDKRFKQLQQSIRKDGIHYLEALARLNSDLNDLSYEQLSMFELSDESRVEYIEKTLGEMLHNLRDEVTRYALISFSDRNNEIFSISASIMTEYLDIVYPESWEEYIQAEYDVVISSLEESYDDNIEEIEDIPLSLKIEAGEEVKLQKDTEKQDKDEN